MPVHTSNPPWTTCWTGDWAIAAAASTSVNIKVLTIQMLAPVYAKNVWNLLCALQPRPPSAQCATMRGIGYQRRPSVARNLAPSVCVVRLLEKSQRIGGELKGLDEHVALTVSPENHLNPLRIRSGRHIDGAAAGRTALRLQNQNT